MIKMFIAQIIISLSISATHARGENYVPYEIQDAAVFAILEADKDAMLDILNAGWDPNFDTEGMGILEALEQESHLDEILGVKFDDLTPEMEEVAQLMFDYGADPNYVSPNFGRTTPLYWAVDGDRTKRGFSICRVNYISFLMKNGADPNKSHRNGGWETAIDNMDPFCGGESTRIILSAKPKLMESDCGIWMSQHYDDYDEHIHRFPKKEDIPGFWIAQYLIDEYGAPDFRISREAFTDWAKNNCGRLF
jgi:hypothetical protein